MTKIRLFLAGKAGADSVQDMELPVVPRVGEEIRYRHVSYKVTDVEYNIEAKGVLNSIIILCKEK